MSSVGAPCVGGWQGASQGGSSGSSCAGSSAEHSGVGALQSVGFDVQGEEAWSSTCVEPDHRELIRSVGTVLHRRVRDNEAVEAKITLPLFMEDTHTEPEPEERFDVTMPMLHLQTLGFPTLFTLSPIPPEPPKLRSYPVPDPDEIATFLENIRQKAHLTPQALVITLIYVDRLEARSEGVLLHARSWRPIVFASILLASKVWHDISYWNSDFCSICPMFHTRNINRMEISYLQLLKYNVLVSASQYATYYFSLRHTVRAPEVTATAAIAADALQSPGEVHAASALRPAAQGPATPPPSQQQPGTTTPEAVGSAGDYGSGGRPVGGGGADKFRNKYLMAINVPAPGWQKQHLDDNSPQRHPPKSMHHPGLQPMRTAMSFVHPPATVVGRMRTQSDDDSPSKARQGSMRRALSVLEAAAAAPASMQRSAQPGSSLASASCIGGQQQEEPMGSLQGGACIGNVSSSVGASSSTTGSDVTTDPTGGVLSPQALQFSPVMEGAPRDELSQQSGSAAGSAAGSQVSATSSSRAARSLAQSDMYSSSL